MAILRLFYILCLIVVFSCEVKQPESVSSVTDNDTTTARVKPDLGKVITLVIKDWKNSDIPLAKIIDSLKVDSGKIRIVITKSEYELGVYCDSVLLKNYPVVFGGNPVDDKLRRGDSCTPEGVFKIKSKYDHKKWSRFIWIDYPNDESWKKHRAAKAKGIVPAAADIGGDIGIHGTPPGWDEIVDYRRNWTLGCISMKNKDVIELFPFITTETIIEIRK